MRLKAKIIPYVLFVLMVGALLFPVFMKGKICAPLDIIVNLYEPWAGDSESITVKNHYATDSPQQYLLYLDHMRESYQQEGQLGWNFLKNCGTPAYANTMAVPFGLAQQLTRFLPLWQAWHIAVAVQYFVALIGMFIFLRGQGCKKALSVLGAVAFAFCAHFAVWLYHLWAAGLVWLPWVCWALYKMREKSRWGLAAPLLLSLAFLGVHLQYAFFLVIATTCLGSAWMLEDWSKGGRRRVRPILQCIGIDVLAVGVAAVMFVPSILAYVNTLRAGMVRGLAPYPHGILSPLLNLLVYPAFLFPQIVGSPQTFDVSKVFAFNLMDMPYFGSVLVALAFIGIFQARLSAPAKFLTVAGLILPLTPLVGFLYHRVLILFSFGGIWLSVEFLQNAGDWKWRRVRICLQWLFLLGTVLLMGASVAVDFLEKSIFDVLWGIVVPEVQSHRFGARPGWFAARLAQFLAEMRIWHPRILWPWLIFGISIWVMRFRKRAFFGWVMTGLVFMQLWLYDREWIVFNDPLNEHKSIYPRTEEVVAIQEEVGPVGRVLVAQKPGRLPLFPLNSISYLGVPCVVGYDSIVPNGIQDNVPMWPVVGKTLPSAHKLGRKGVSHLITFAEDDHPHSGWRPIRESGKISIYSNEYAMAWYRVKGPGGIRSVKPSLHEHNRRRLIVPAGTSKVMLKENWDEGWQFRIDNGKWRYMEKAQDRSMFAKFSPPGNRTIYEMRYRPRARLLGITISLVSVLAYAAWCWCFLRKREKTGGKQYV